MCDAPCRIELKALYEVGCMPRRCNQSGLFRFFIAKITIFGFVGGARKTVKIIICVVGKKWPYQCIEVLELDAGQTFERLGVVPGPITAKKNQFQILF
jgi:hypothetical protein